MWGALIDPVCQRYGWTMDYVVWGISLVNLNMITGDAIDVLYDIDNDNSKRPKNEVKSSSEGAKREGLSWGEFLSAMHQVKSDISKE